jgi:tRNA(Ile)-lysidine synthase
MNSVMRALWEVRRFMETLPLGMASGVVAVSGGADSVALLRALHSLYPASLTVAHINHRLRGEESDADDDFVRQLAGQLALTYRVKAIDVGEMAEGANLEATARQVRYEFLAEVAASAGAAWIATGHTADDQAETVLHRLIRGTGLQGLRGIARRQSRIVRPLLTVTRAEVIEYLSSLNQTFREDSSNLDPRFTRNRLRREVLPLLKTFNPALVTALGQIAAQAGEAFELLEAEAASWVSDVELPRAGNRLILDATKFASAHPYRIRELLRLLWQREGWPVTDMTADHWSRLVAVAQGNLTAADFPEGISARRIDKVVQIGK